MAIVTTYEFCYYMPLVRFHLQTRELSMARSNQHIAKYVYDIAFYLTMQNGGERYHKHSNYSFNHLQSFFQ